MTEDRMDIFTAHNHHADPAPDWMRSPRAPREVRSYFENNHEEQWIASATPERFLLAGGDTGWKTIRVDNPDYAYLTKEAMPDRSSSGSGFQGIILNIEERLWLAAVLMAASR